MPNTQWGRGHSASGYSGEVTIPGDVISPTWVEGKVEKLPPERVRSLGAEQDLTQTPFMVYDVVTKPLRERPTMAKYDIKVELVGNDGNAFSIMGAVTKAMRRAGVSREEQDEYFKQATAGDYNQLLATTMEWVEVV
jgi:hypothetical protein